MSTTSRRALRILGVVFAFYAVLVASHEGEFWPFSIYPMFSQAGQPWNRAVVREVPPGSPVRWDTLTWATLPGESYGTQHDGNIDAIDLANFVGKTTDWTQAHADPCARSCSRRATSAASWSSVLRAASSRAIPSR